MYAHPHGSLSVCTHCFMIKRLKHRKGGRAEKKLPMSQILKWKSLHVIAAVRHLINGSARVTSQLISTSAQKGGGGMPSAADATPHPLNSHGYARHAKRTAAHRHIGSSWQDHRVRWCCHRRRAWWLAQGTSQRRCLYHLQKDRVPGRGSPFFDDLSDGH